MPPLLSRPACVLFAIVLSIAGGARADSVSDPIGPAAALSDMQAARLLIRAGRLGHARAFLEQTAPSTDAERIERLFLLGRIEMRLGLPAAAAQRFEAALAIRPDLPRVRLELARAYFLAGVDDRARHHFRLSLDDALPSSVEAVVETLLRRLDVRERWSASVSAAMLPVTERSQRDTVRIGGVPFRLNQDAKSSSGHGALLGGGASYSHPLPGRFRGVLATSGAAKLYERSDWNEVTATGEAGLAHLLDGRSISAGLRVTRVWSPGVSDRVGFGPWVRSGWRWSQATRFDVSVAADRRRHDESRGRDGWRMVVEPRLAHAYDGQHSVVLEPTFEVVSTDLDHFGSHLIGVGATVSRVLDGGISVSLSASAEIRRHAARDRLFGIRRVDRTERVSFRIGHRSWRFGGFAPYVGYSHERTRSNIPVHAHRARGFTVGLTRRY